VDEDGSVENENKLLKVQVVRPDGNRATLVFPRFAKHQYKRMIELKQFVVSHLTMKRPFELDLTPQSRVMSAEEFAAADPKEFAEKPQRANVQTGWDPRHPVVVEFSLVSLGSSHLLPHLVVLLDNGDLLLYRGFRFSDVRSPILPLRFKRLEHNVLCRNFKTPSATSGYGRARRRANAWDDSDSDDDDEDDTKIISTERHRWNQPRIVPFSCVDARRGAFVSGTRPVWIIAERDYARTFKMDIDGAVAGFTEFNNINCPDGFVYYASQSVRTFLRFFFAQYATCL
jgi:hypothetical protein